MNNYTRNVQLIVFSIILTISFITMILMKLIVITFNMNDGIYWNFLAGFQFFWTACFILRIAYDFFKVNKNR
jgi:hypothetical protein